MLIGGSRYSAHAAGVKDTRAAASTPARAMLCGLAEQVVTRRAACFFASTGRTDAASILGGRGRVRGRRMADEGSRSATEILIAFLVNSVNGEIKIHVASNRDIINN